MANQKIKKTMNKRGQAEVVVGAFLLIVLLVAGGIGSLKIILENQYVGDESTLLYYDLKKCDIIEIDRNNLVNFKNLEEAKANGYLPAKCSL